MPAAQGYIGRNPADSSTVIARQSFSPTGIQTDFTFAAGYEVGYVDLYLNGARLVEGQDFTATNGSTVGLTTNAVNGDVLEVVAFKAFNVASVTTAGGDFTVGNNLTVSGTSAFTGAITATGGVVGDITGDVTGDVTGDATGLSGTPDLTIRNITGVAATFTGILSYDDVVNVDSIGIITARSHVSIADSILHTGDTDTAIRFPAADTFTVETAGNERLRITSTGRQQSHAGYAGVGINTFASWARTGGAIRAEVGYNAVTTDYMYFGTGTDHPLALRVNNNDAVYIKNDGKVGINTTPGTLLEIQGASGKEATVTFNREGVQGSNDGVIGEFLFENATDSVAQVSVKRESAADDAYIQFATQATGGGLSERLRVDSSGRLLKSGQASLTSTSLNHPIQVAAASDANAIAIFGRAADDIAELSYYEADKSTKLGEIQYRQDHVNFRHRVGYIAFAAGGTTERARIDSSGRLLINATSNVGSSSMLQVREDGFGRNVEIFRSYNSANTPARIRFSNSRGTGSSPTIVADDDDLGEIRFNGHDGTNYDTPAAAIFGVVDGTPGENDMPGRLEFHTTADGGSSTTERLRIDRDGLITQGGKTASDHGSPNLLIWGSDPTVHLTSTNSTNNSSFTGIKFAVAGGSTGDYSKAGIFVQRQDSYNDLDMIFAFRSSNDAVGVSISDEKLRITSDGNMLIGTTTPTGNTDRLLQVGDTSRASTYIEVRTSTSGASGVVFSDNDDGSGSTGYRGTIEYAHSTDQLQFKTAGTTRLTCDSSGNFTATGNVTAYSDVTLKENIETIPNALDKVLNLRGVEFDRNDKENNPHEIGVIAQEVEEVVPEVVMTNEEGLKSVAYGNLVGLLIESIKELKAEVNDLKAQLEG